MRRRFIFPLYVVSRQTDSLSAVAAAAEGTCAAAAVAGSVEDEKSDDHEPDYLVVKKIAKTVHFIFTPARCRRDPFV